MILDENSLNELTDEDARNLVRLLTDEDARNIVQLLNASLEKAVGERMVPATDNQVQYYNKGQRVRDFIYLFFLGFSFSFIFARVISFVTVCSDDFL